MDAKRGDWVRIDKIILYEGQRAPDIPEDTKNTPLKMWNKGFLVNKCANIGDEVEVETYIGRKTKGTLIEVNPYWKHDFGKAVPEILYIGIEAKEILSEEGEL